MKMTYSFVYHVFLLDLVDVTYSWKLLVQAHVEYETGKRHYAHVDCPGHADYVKVRRKSICSI